VYTPNEDDLRRLKQNFTYHAPTGTQTARYESIRNSAPTGEDHPRAKFTNAQAEEVRQLRGKMTQEEIAKMYGVSRSAIEGIMIGRTYKI
jgi:hypothetical protein